MARIQPLNADGPLPKAPPKHKAPRRAHDKGYLAWLHELPCCVSGVTDGVIAHHITIGRGRMGVKADDSLALPLHHSLHTDYPQALHVIGEKKFWNSHGIDPFLLASNLYKAYTDYSENLDFAKAFLKFHKQLGFWCASNGIKHFEEKTR